MILRRDTYTAAVLFQGAGQTSEDEIFENSSGSADYREFLESLGWMVRTSSLIYTKCVVKGETC
jgi:hypothetical protein